MAVPTEWVAIIAAASAGVAGVATAAVKGSFTRASETEKRRQDDLRLVVDNLKEQIKDLKADLALQEIDVNSWRAKYEETLGKLRQLEDENRDLKRANQDQGARIGELEKQVAGLVAQAEAYWRSRDRGAE